jgi:O-antigen/teichoic acid export membrane protein
LAARLGRNALFTLGGRLWYVAIWFLATPYVLDRLGDERFGVWSLLFLLSGYLATFDLGLGTAVIKVTAEHSGTAAWDRLRAVLADVNRIYIFLGILWVVAIFALHPLILSWLKISPEHWQEVRFTVLASAVVFAFANLVTAGTGVLNGLQRMDLSNSLLIFTSIPHIGILLVGLHLGYGLYAVVVSTLVQWSVLGIGTWLMLRRVAPKLGWPPLRLTGKGTGEWFRFSAFMQANNVIVLTQQQIDKPILALVLGVATVTVFELGFRVAAGVQSLAMLVLVPLLPAFAEIHGREDRAGFRSLWERASRVVTIGSLALGAAAIPAAPYLMRAWVGPGYPESELLAQWLLLGFLLNLTTGVSSAATRGAGHPEFEVVPGVVGIAVHVIGSVLLLRIFGPAGVGPAFCLGMLVSAVLFFVRFARWYTLSLRELFTVVLRPAAPAFVAGLVAGYAVAAVLPAALQGSRPGLLAACAITAGAGVLGYAAVLLLTGGWGSLRADLAPDRTGEPGGESAG